MFISHTLRHRSLVSVCQVLASYLAFWVLTCTSAHAQSITDNKLLNYPATGLWNGFNEHLNVVECNNFAAQNISAQLTLRNSDGTGIQAFSFTVPAHGTSHFILNQFDIANRYGIYTVSLVLGSQGLGGQLRCSTSIYRLRSDASEKAIDYAYSLPTLNPITGTTAGIFNSFNPSGGLVPTFNWLSVYNPGDAAFSATVELYDQSGALSGSFPITALAPGNRRDFPLGHEDAGNGGQVVGIYRIVPDDSDQDYGAVLTRYGNESGSPSFAFPIFASRGSCDEEPLFASTMGPASNWAEFANIAASARTLSLDVRANTGGLLNEQEFILQPFQQAHFYLNQYLGDNNIGSVLASCASPTETGIIAQSLFYGRPTTPSLTEWAYASQSRGLRSLDGEKLVFPVNTYLGIQNWIRLVDGGWNGATVALETYISGGGSVLADSFSLPENNTIDIGANLNFQQDSAGAYAVGSNTLNAQLVGETLRVFPKANGGIGYIMPVVPAVIPGDVLQVSLQQVVAGFDSPIYVTNAGDGSNRLFIVEQGGLIKILADGAVLQTPFLDVSSLVDFGGERGLLSVAFHPSYETNRRFFIYYTRESDGDIVIAEYSASLGDPNVADPASGRIVLTIDHSDFGNHNGGQLQFGPDGYLYAGTGDGGGGGDPLESGQNLDTLLGKILRIDVDGAQPYAVPPTNPFVGVDGRDEIFAYGLRNPWRFSFDRLTGRLFAGDVGQNSREEIDIIVSGGNYGWDVMEGSLCFEPSSGCDTSGKILPIAEYTHDEGISITGGYVYRGSTIASLVGKYVFGDYSGSRIWVLTEGEDDTWTRSELLSPAFLISSFGEDEAGELYVLNYDGVLYRIVADN